MTFRGMNHEEALGCVCVFCVGCGFDSSEVEKSKI